jgi:hypothetical protein
MNNILEDWVLMSNNLDILKTTFGNGWKSTESVRTRKNMLEKILKSNGFVYRIITEQKEGEYQVNFIFRQKRVKNFSKVHENWLKKNNLADYLSSEFKWIEL